MTVCAHVHVYVRGWVCVYVCGWVCVCVRGWVCVYVCEHASVIVCHVCTSGWMQYGHNNNISTYLHYEIKAAVHFPVHVVVDSYFTTIWVNPKSLVWKIDMNTHHCISLHHTVLYCIVLY